MKKFGCIALVSYVSNIYSVKLIMSWYVGIQTTRFQIYFQYYPVILSVSKKMYQLHSYLSTQSLFAVTVDVSFYSVI